MEECSALLTPIFPLEGKGRKKKKAKTKSQWLITQSLEISDACAACQVTSRGVWAEMRHLQRSQCINVSVKALRLGFAFALINTLTMDLSFSGQAFYWAGVWKSLMICMPRFGRRRYNPPSSDIWMQLPERRNENMWLGYEDTGLLW